MSSSSPHQNSSKDPTGLKLDDATIFSLKTNGLFETSTLMMLNPIVKILSPNRKRGALIIAAKSIRNPNIPAKIAFFGLCNLDGVIALEWAIFGQNADKLIVVPNFKPRKNMRDYYIEAKNLQAIPD